MNAAKKPTLSWTLSRADFVSFRVLLLAAPVIYLITVVAPKVMDWARGKALVWSALFDRPGPAISGLSDRATVTYADLTSWTVPGASAAQWVGSLLPGLVTMALLIGGCCAVWRLVGLTQRGDPFGPAGVRVTRWLAAIVMAYGVLLPFANALANLMVLFPIQNEPAVYFRIQAADAAPLVIGLLMLLVAECFRLGLRLRDDVEGLV